MHANDPGFMLYRSTVPTTEQGLQEHHLVSVWLAHRGGSIRTHSRACVMLRPALSRICTWCLVILGLLKLDDFWLQKADLVLLLRRWLCVLGHPWVFLCSCCRDFHMDFFYHWILMENLGCENCFVFVCQNYSKICTGASRIKFDTHRYVHTEGKSNGRTKVHAPLHTFSSAPISLASPVDGREETLADANVNPPFVLIPLLPSEGAVSRSSQGIGGAGFICSSCGETMRVSIPMTRRPQCRFSP
jgi:hypothetical protein